MLCPFLETSGQPRRSGQLGGFGGQSQNHRTVDCPLLAHIHIFDGTLWCNRVIWGEEIERLYDRQKEGKPPIHRWGVGGGWVPLVPVDRGKAAEGGLRLTAVLGKPALRTHVQTLVSTPASSLAGLFHFSIFYLYLRQLNKVMKQNDFLLTLSVLAVRHVFWSQCSLNLPDNLRRDPQGHVISGPDCSGTFSRYLWPENLSIIENWPIKPLSWFSDHRGFADTIKWTCGVSFIRGFSISINCSLNNFQLNLWRRSCKWLPGNIYFGTVVVKVVGLMVLSVGKGTTIVMAMRAAIVLSLLTCASATGESVLQKLQKKELAQYSEVRAF